MTNKIQTILSFLRTIKFNTRFFFCLFNSNIKIIETKSQVHQHLEPQKTNDERPSLALVIAIRAFPSTLLKNLAFTISTNFIIYNTSLYNIYSIKTSILFNTAFKYSFFIIFIHFLFFLALLSVSLFIKQIIFFTILLNWAAISSNPLQLDCKMNRI